MGAVYEAVQEPIERRVAIKVLHGRYAQEPEIATRFFNEARAVNIVDHPGIVQISDYGQLPTGVAYLVMELIKGDTLGKRIKTSGGKLPVPETVRLCRQLAAALAAAHEKGVVHRDLKPDNVMLVPDPDPDAPGRLRVKLLDFGIAKVAAEISQNAAQTAADVVMGTPKYMSPEQCRGAGSVDDKSDVYALGIIVYEMLTGAPPFVGATGEILAKQIYEEPQQLREVAPWVPEQLAALIHRLLQKNKADRPTMRQAAAEFDQLSFSYPTTMHAIIDPNAMPGRMPSVSGMPVPTGLGSGSAPVVSPNAGHGPSPSIVLSQVDVESEQPDSDRTPTPSQLAAVRNLPLPDKDSNSGLKQSTLGYSVGQSSLSMKAPRPRRLLLGIALSGLTAVGALVTLLVIRSREPVAIPMEVVRPAVRPVKRTVHWRVTSTPAGADVVRADSNIEVGRTPWQSDPPLGTGKVTMKVRFPGYLPREVELDSASDSQSDVTLDPEPPPQPQTKPKPTWTKQRPSGTGKQGTPPMTTGTSKPGALPSGTGNGKTPAGAKPVGTGKPAQPSTNNPAGKQKTPQQPAKPAFKIVD